MLINKQIKNTFYTIKRQTLDLMPNMLYSEHGSFFDIALNDMPTTAPAIIALKNKMFIDSSYYNVLWLNDLIDFSQKIPYYGSFFTNIFIAIHDAPASFFKKEDITILQNNVGKYNIISFTNHFHEWALPNVHHISYGVPRPMLKFTETKNKNILIINTKQKKQTNILFQYLNQEFPHTDLLQDMPETIQDAQQLIARYKICIDFDYYYNLLVANSCGTYGITSLNSNDKFIYNTQNSGQIISIIKMLLANQDNEQEQISNLIIEKYNWNLFVKNICAYINNIYYKDLII